MHKLSNLQRQVLTDLLTGTLHRHPTDGCYLCYQTPTGQAERRKVLCTTCRRLNNLGLIEATIHTRDLSLAEFELTDANRAVVAEGE